MANEKFYLTLDCGNDAFREDPCSEIARILRDAASRAANLEPNDRPILLRDINGNKVGAMWVTSED